MLAATPVLGGQFHFLNVEMYQFIINNTLASHKRVTKIKLGFTSDRLKI